MSSMINGAFATGNIIVDDDANCLMRPYTFAFVEWGAWFAGTKDKTSVYTFASGWWPNRAGFICSADDNGMNMDTATQSVWYEEIDSEFMNSGHWARYAISGVTRDVNGSPLGGVEVTLFKNVDGGYPGTADTKVDQEFSDANGNYTVTTPYYPDTHYIVAYKAGSPDVEGTTVNTLIGS